MLEDFDALSLLKSVELIMMYGFGNEEVVIVFLGYHLCNINL